MIAKDEESYKLVSLKCNYFNYWKCLGASSDLKQATSIAAHMVRDWGMSEKIGLRTMPEGNKPFSAEQLGPSTNEQVT